MTFLLAQYESLLNHKFAQFTWETAVELMCNEKQRNRENFNFKSVASAISPHHRRRSQQSRMELGYVSAIDSNGRTLWIADAHRGDGKRFVVQADELLTAFLELAAAVRADQ
jgi:hypothetical protein